MSGLGASMAGGNSSTGRKDEDFYPSPFEVTEALLNNMTFSRGGVKLKVHECACGTGDMAEVIKAHGYDVVSTDLIDRGYGATLDFLTLAQPLAPVVITNPPFNLAGEFIEHALDDLRIEALALVLKSTYWHAKTRKPLFDRFKPRIVAPLLWRPDFLGLGRPTMEVAWTIWTRGYSGSTEYRPLEKPTARRVISDITKSVRSE